ncbi:UDP-N-acetylglucosamine 2-epimerase (non-hydrolysing) [Parasphingorhabdus marina DSM 22363]|uniref:UDP-N-acetylglucosamine 2-epimerase (Non-hydrolysing) n=1 Tax=Parasphingorhabdus marina DSM 22363 TaxID=1123272 RepID=A0A1N6HQT5_9SPHN|nr:UDP-N-acetylglucosamine 2-epimerase (non-hydrolyzing) [Parasphingorhabdus marina]SIO22049.1 UDP-N-acetylglucosamine 2-epimerase (non-hydrolysing) [Parasphingorhabdus marina DSM 22363]
MTKLKVVTILGTRPEIIRLSQVMKGLRLYCDHVLVHTGQNWDYELNEVFFEDLEIPKPDYFLGVGGGSLGETLGGILAETEKVLEKEAPDAVLILGDTNSAISAIMARRMKIPIYHMEAGNRSFDRNVPEETNRLLVDHIADFNLVYTEHARRHLLTEGIAHRRINLTGSPMREVLDQFSRQIAESEILSTLGLTRGEFFVVSLHREENVDNQARLKVLLEALNELGEKYGYPLVVSTHPRTRQRLEKLDMSVHKNVAFEKPFGFHDYNRLQKSAFCVISDSGTIAEEASILGFPAITPRDAIERPEGIDVGCIMMTGVDKESIVNAVEIVTRMYEERGKDGSGIPIPADYTITNTSERVVKHILGTARVSNKWDGIRLNDQESA